MKKIMVLALIVSMASLASAGLVLSVNGTNVADGGSFEASGVVTIGIYNDAVSASAYELGGLMISGGSYTDAEVIAANLPGSWDLTYAPDAYGAGYEAYYLIAYTTPAVADTLMGNLFTFDVDYGVDGGTAQILDPTLAGIGSGINITAAAPPVPEPMTMALLGLGGLFLRRRK